MERAAADRPLANLHPYPDSASRLPKTKAATTQAAIRLNLDQRAIVDAIIDNDSVPYTWIVKGGVSRPTAVFHSLQLRCVVPEGDARPEVMGTKVVDPLDSQVAVDRPRPLLGQCIGVTRSSG